MIHWATILLLTWLEMGKCDIEMAYKSKNLAPLCRLRNGDSGTCISVSACSSKKGNMIGSCVKKNGFGVCCKDNITFFPNNVTQDAIHKQTDREDSIESNYINTPMDLSDPDDLFVKSQMPPLVSELHQESHSAFYHKTSSWPTPGQALYFKHTGGYSNPSYFPKTSKHKPIKQEANLETICGKSMIRHPHIFNGKDVMVGEFPWQLSLRSVQGFSSIHQCGAVLVHPKWALTAAHCAFQIPKESMVIRGGSNIVVNNQVSEITSNYWEGSVAQVYLHPDFNYNIMKIDIALLELNTAFPVSDYLRPICLPPEGDFIGKTVTISGWGKNESEGITQNILKKVELPVISNKMCYEWIKHSRPAMEIEDTLICAGYKNGGKDSCEGDSGGPAQLQIDQRWTLIGIISWGTRECGKPYSPAFFTKVNDFTDWIANVTKNKVFVPSFFLTDNPPSTTIIDDSTSLPNTSPYVEATKEVEATTIYNLETSLEVEATTIKLKSYGKRNAWKPFYKIPMHFP